MIKKYFLFIGIVCVLLVSVFMTWARQQMAYEHIKTTALSQLTLAEQVIEQPYMPIIEVAGPKGDIISLPEKDKFMLISLWSTKCKACANNLSTLKKLQRILRGYKEDWKIIGVSIDAPDDLEKVTRVIKKYNLSEIAEYYDAHGTLFKYIDPKAIPVTLIINNKGRVMYKVYGTAPWLNSDVIAFLRATMHKK